MASKQWKTSHRKIDKQMCSSTIDLTLSSMKHGGCQAMYAVHHRYPLRRPSRAFRVNRVLEDGL